VNFDLDQLRRQLARDVAREVARELREEFTPQSPWMSTAEAIEYSALPPGTFRKKAAAGEIPSHGGKTKIFHRAEVDRALGYERGTAVPNGRGTAVSDRGR
jgi:hypothetical protein